MEPLFAHNSALWLRIWAGTAASALVIAIWVAVDAGGGIRPFWHAAGTPWFLAAFGVLVVYHAAGFWGRRWMMQRPWAVLVFVPLGWLLVMVVLARHSGFSVLLLSAILQGFLFLPFEWAIVSLVLADAMVTVGVGMRASWSSPAATLLRVGWIPAAGIMIGTVLLYIHRSNQDAAARTALLAELRAAQDALATRERERGAQEERARFARDIHDTLAQGFVSVLRHLDAVELSALETGADEDDARQRRAVHIAHAHAVSRTSLAEIRRLVFALRPAELEGESLSAALARVVARWSEVTGIQTTFASDPLPSFRPDADVIFLRSAQEALSNVARHAGARQVAVSLSIVSQLAFLTIEDDGAGFSAHEAQKGERMGLASMRERARAVDGYVLVDSILGAGTSVTVALPIAGIIQQSAARGETA
jgi:signal transduction histidine kinase